MSSTVRVGLTHQNRTARRDIERTLGRIDSYPYRHRVRDVMRAPAKFVDSDTPLNQAMKIMMDDRISSLFVRFAGKYRD